MKNLKNSFDWSNWYAQLVKNSIEHLKKGDSLHIHSLARSIVKTYKNLSRKPVSKEDEDYMQKRYEQLFAKAHSQVVDEFIQEMGI